MPGIPACIFLFTHFFIQLSIHVQVIDHTIFENRIPLQSFPYKSILLKDTLGGCIRCIHKPGDSYNVQFRERDLTNLTDSLGHDSFGPVVRQKQIADFPILAIHIRFLLDGNISHDLAVYCDGAKHTVLAIMLRHHSQPPIRRFLRVGVRQAI